jgi:hypothetical protein
MTTNWNGSRLRAASCVTGRYPLFNVSPCDIRPKPFRHYLIFWLLKSAFDGDLRLLSAVADALRAYRGAVCLESFDPALIAHLRLHAARMGIAHIPLGIVGEGDYTARDWPQLSSQQRQEMTHFLHYPQTRPDFISWNVADLPHAIPFLAREGLRLPVTTWTIRTEEQALSARQWTDQIVFEGYTPA